MHFQRLATGEYFDRVDALFKMEEAIGGSAAIPWAEFAKVLPLNEVTRNVITMTRATANSTWMSTLYLGNLLNKLNAGHKGSLIANELQQLNGNIATQSDAINQCMVEKDTLNGEKAQLLQNDKTMKDIRQGSAGVKTYHEKEREQIKTQCQAAEADLKNFTYKCYGPFKWVWQNDVDLAKSKVDRYTAKLEEINKKIEECVETDRELQMEEMRMNLCKEMAKVEAGINNADRKLVAGRAKKEELEKVRDEKLKKLVFLCKENGCESIDELLDAMDAMKSVGAVGSSISTTGAVVLEGWIKDLNFLGVSLERMSRGKDLASQRRVLQVLKDFIQKPENQFCEFLRVMTPLTNIPSLETREPYQRTNLPIFNASEIAKTIDWEAEQAALPATNTDWADVPVAQADEDQLYERMVRSDEPLEMLVSPVEEPMANPVNLSDGVDLDPVDEFAGEFDD